MWKCENFLSSLAPLARIFIEVRSCFVGILSFIAPYHKRELHWLYMYIIIIQMCFHVFMFLRDFNRFFSLFFFFFPSTNSDPVSVCVVLYIIILIQILIRYNVKNLITACTRSLDFDLKNWKISLSWDTPLPDPPPARELRSLAFVTFPLGAPPMRWPTVRHWLTSLPGEWK